MRCVRINNIFIKLPPSQATPLPGGLSTIALSSRFAFEVLGAMSDFRHTFRTVHKSVALMGLVHKLTSYICIFQEWGLCRAIHSIQFPPFAVHLQSLLNPSWIILGHPPKGGRVQMSPSPTPFLDHALHLPNVRTHWCKLHSRRHPFSVVHFLQTNWTYAHV